MKVFFNIWKAKSISEKLLFVFYTHIVSYIHIYTSFKFGVCWNKIPSVLSKYTKCWVNLPISKILRNNEFICCCSICDFFFMIWFGTKWSHCWRYHKDGLWFHWRPTDISVPVASCIHYRIIYKTIVGIQFSHLDWFGSWSI